MYNCFIIHTKSVELWTVKVKIPDVSTAIGTQIIQILSKASHPLIAIALNIAGPPRTGDDQVS